MSWRILHISNEIRLSLRKNTLQLHQSDTIYSIPLEDIGVLVLENRGISVTSALLDACVRHKVTVLVCDEKHLPSGTLLGYQQHSRQSAVIAKQLSWSSPFRKRIWQKITQTKISNQARVFAEITGTSSPSIESYARSVQSGDRTNREGAAAREYFQNILPQTLIRHADDRINGALNYGYAILRGTMARSLASYGFLTSIGIHHKSDLNNFNLADDLIEPYRPYVDRFVFKNISFEGELTKEDRIGLVNLFTNTIGINNQTHTLLRACDLTVQSLVTATVSSDPQAIVLPIYEQ